MYEHNKAREFNRRFRRQGALQPWVEISGEGGAEAEEPKDVKKWLAGLVFVSEAKNSYEVISLRNRH